MLDNIISQLKGAIGPDVKQKTGLDDQKADKAIELAGHSAKEVAEDEVSKGNMQGLMNLLGNKGNESHANPLVSRIGANYVGKLINQLGLSPEVAQNVERVVVPLMINFVSQRFNESKGAGGIGGMLGGNLGGLAGALGGFFKK